ncbi:MAG: hypothetical protein WC205_16910 [Opitutaceae bacterium]|jgi:hypothetical protein
MKCLQTDVKRGLLDNLPAVVDLTDKTGHLVLVVNGGFTTPTADTDIATHVLVEDGAIGDIVSALPLTALDQVRAVAKGAGNQGDNLVLALVATAGDRGKLRVLPATPGVYVQIGRAEEDFVDGQHLKFRPLIKLIIVPSVVAAPAAAAPADGVFAALNSTAVNPTKADFDALLVQLELLNDSHIATVAKLTAMHTAAVANGQVVIA